MKIIEAKLRELDYKDYKLRGANVSDFTTLVKDPVTLMHDGEVKVVYDHLPFDTTPYKEAFKKIKYQKTERTAGLKTVSRIFGFAPRVTMRKDFCSATSLSTEDPEAHAAIVELGQKIAGIYLQRAPEVFQKHSETLRENMKEDQWVIPNTPFTSGIINKNNPLKYHFDTGNFKKVFSCMVAFKHDCEGGHLSLPEYDMGLEIADNSILLFDGQEILHGVTPFKLLSDEGYRFTAVFYSLRGMWECLTVDDEIARIRNIKTQRERKRVKSNEPK